MQGRVNDSLGFAVSPTIHNRPVHLEVDQSRQREFRRWLLVGFILLAAALFDGWQRAGIVSHGFRMVEIEGQRAAEDHASRRLRLEIASLRSPRVIEELALRRLHLVPPGPADAIVIERVIPPDQPPSSVVASR